MRVVAGLARGRRLRVPKGRQVRPTADRVKEAVFSMLQSRNGCSGVAVLDLFAGSGSLGIEALSRGATEAVFVEPSRRATLAIRGNLHATGFRGEVMTMSAARAIAALRARGRRFGGVFLDPPYGRGWVTRTLGLLAESRLVGEGGWIVVEHGKDETPAPRFGAFACRVSRRYGDTCIALFIVEETSDEA